MQASKIDVCNAVAIMLFLCSMLALQTGICDAVMSLKSNHNSIMSKMNLLQSATSIMCITLVALCNRFIFHMMLWLVLRDVNASQMPVCRASMLQQKHLNGKVQLIAECHKHPKQSGCLVMP